MNRPLQVGITGGIGSGKSLVCHIFLCLGIPVYDADSRAKSLMMTDKILRDQIKKEFGAMSYYGDGTLNRTHIRKTTFGNPDKLSTLNKLVHPRVAVDYLQWADAHKGDAYLLREAALLYEAGSYTSVDKMIVVSAPEDLRIKRVMQRDLHLTEEDIKIIIKSQWPEQEKLRRADFILCNDDKHMVIPQVLELHGKFIAGL